MITKTKKILLLSAYDAQSHKRWRESIVSQFPDVSWTQLVLAPRYFSWRIRGNSMIWAFGEKDTLNQDFDLILATSMVDLSSLIGMSPNLAKVPSVLYFHENQYAYPQTSEQYKSIEPFMVSLYSALSASFLKFNSQYNLDSFLDGVDALLKRFPDKVPCGILDSLRAKSSVLPVPIEDACFKAELESLDINDCDALDHFSRDQRPDFKASQDDCYSNLARKIRCLARKKKTVREQVKLEIVWNHRWEYDKGPNRLHALLSSMDPRLPVRFHIVGQTFRKSPPIFDEIYGLLQEKKMLGNWGYIRSSEEYRALLASSDVVLSTAIHDFQGLSVIEACALGCLPLLPNRLSYPEFFPSRCLYTSEYDNGQAHENDDFTNETLNCLMRIKSLCKTLCSPPDLCSPQDLPALPNLRRFSWSALRPNYQTILE